MDDRARRIEELFHQALDLPADRRDAFLDAQCGDDPSLRAEVEALIAHLPETHDFADHPPVRLGEPDRHVGDPETIGPYRILGRLGEGGFGIVYEAEQTQPIRRRVALKVVKAGMDTETVLARFEAERQALALMDHPNIARVLDAGATEGARPYFVMELVRGDPITTYCDRERVPLAERLRLFQRVCHAVQHAHQKGVIHRDLKPGNILITLVDGKPVPKVIDFGIAKAVAAPLTDRPLRTVAGQMIGTPVYMSPEQAERTGLDVDTTTDVYSLGVVLYELLSGNLPFDPDRLRDLDPADVHRILRDEEPARPSARITRVGDTAVSVAKSRRLEPWTLSSRLKGDLDWIVMRAMEKDRVRRYQTALELGREIERYLASEPVLAGPPGMRYRVRKFARRHRGGIALAGAVAGGLVIAAGGLTWALVESNRQRERAEAARTEAEAVTDFVAGMLASVTPGEEGRDVTVKQVLDGAAPTLGEDFADQPLIEARLRTVIGDTYRQLGEFDAAQEQLESAVELHRSVRGPTHNATLNSRRELGLLQRDRGRYAAAESTLMDVLRELEAGGASEPEDILIAMNDLGTIYTMSGRHRSAVDILERARQRAQGTLPPTHDGVLQIEAQLAVAYAEEGRMEEALPLLIRGLERDQERNGPDHVETITAMANLAGVYRELDRTDQAIPLYEQVAERGARVYGDDHPTTIRFYHNLALAYSDQGRFDKAEPLSRRVYETRKELLGADNQSTLVSGINLALLYLRMERWDDCKEVATVTSRELHRQVGPNHLYSIAVDGTLASAAVGRGDLVAGERALRAVAKRSADSLGKDHWRYGRIRVTHGECLTAMGRHAEAETEILGGQSILAATFEPDHRLCRRAVQALVGLYEAWGREADAALWRARVLPEGS